METYCEIDKCIHCNDKDNINPHFCLVLYGWKDCNIIQPWNRTLVDNILPDTFWNRT